MGLSFVSYTVSSKDVPGRWSLVLFMKGCNFRCRHCHNWRLVVGEEKEEITEREVLYEVSSNPVIDTLVLSGGEPTVHNPKKLMDFILRVKSRNPLIKIRVDTNGYAPQVLEKLRDLVDGFAVDIRSPMNDPNKYSYTAGRKVDTYRVRDSAYIADGLPLTIYRTPRYPWLREEDFSLIEEFTSSLSSPWHLNEFYEVPSCPFNETNAPY